MKFPGELHRSSSPALHHGSSIARPTTRGWLQAPRKVVASLPYPSYGRAPGQVHWARPTRRSQRPLSAGSSARVALTFTVPRLPHPPR